MSVSFANAVVAGLRSYGVPVRFWSGWDRRGNGQVSDYRGMTWHHTASNYGKAYATLVNGHSTLPGPICNSSGDDDGGVTIIAAHPANHAGASGGRNMGPLPVTRSFNKHMWGHEIVYPGVKPMTDAQYRTAVILGAVVSKVLRRPNADWCRGHAETSITGKWDPGYAPNKTYDLNKMRRESTAMMGVSPGPAPAPSPVISTGDDEMGMLPIVVPPTKGLAAMRLAIPVGKASSITARAWVSMVVNGESKGSGRVWAQSDTGGIADRWFNIPYDAAANRSARDWWELPSGTTQVNIHYDMPEGGCILLEWQGK